MKEEEPDDMPEIDNSTCIELSFRGKKYYLKCDRRQWILHRQRTWAEATDKKPAHWNYNGTSHFGRFEHLWNELAQELPRVCESKTMKDIHQAFLDTQEFLKTTLEPFATRRG